MWTSGGASPTFDMMLHMIRRNFGATTALDVASIFVYDETHAASDAQPAVSLGRMQHQAPELADAIRLMERTIDRPLSLDVLARRLERAHRLLLHRGQTANSIGAIAYACGFGDLSYFNRTFRRRFEMTPTDVRNGRG